SSLLPSNPNRSLLVHSLVASLGLLRTTPDSSADANIRVLRPPPATPKELAAYHDKDYISFLLDPALPSSAFDPQTQSKLADFGLEDDCPPFRGLPEYVQSVAGASLAAARALAQDSCDVSICWDGGRHHAHKARASGFCYVNDCVLALLSLKRAPVPSPPSAAAAAPPRKPRIMYLDLDLHFSDGVSSAFHTPTPTSPSPSPSPSPASAPTPAPQFLTLSLHHAAPGFFPPSPLSALPTSTSDPFTLSLPLRPGASPATLRRVWLGPVERVASAFKPDYLVLQCGADALAGDPCAVANGALGGPGGLGWCVHRALRQWHVKTLLLGGGGYDSPNAARAWAYLTSIALDAPLPLDTPIPDRAHAAFPLYAPAFTLDVPASAHRPDENTSAYLDHVERVFDAVVQRIEARVAGAGASAR
ncbi:hypothetical protein HETIRDRAFT_320612, partial [Heterobasidion irregulare TC 32-1]